METDLVGALTEALTADVEAVLSDDTALVTADTAVVDGNREMRWTNWERTGRVSIQLMGPSSASSTITQRTKAAE